MKKITSLIVLLYLAQFSLAFAEQSLDKKRSAAAHPATSAEDLQRYAKDSDWQVRLVVARRQTAPANILMQLAKDENTKVRAALAHNIRAPRKALEPLVNDPDTEVRLSLAHCGYTPPDLLEKLLVDSSPEVRQQTIENLNLPIESLKKVAKGNSELSARAKIFLDQRIKDSTTE